VYDSTSLAPIATIAVGPRAWWTALTRDGKLLYVTVGRANEVVAVDTTTNAVAARIPAGTLPWGIAIVDVK
jgi:YVTN family beta-propeller protein